MGELKHQAEKEKMQRRTRRGWCCLSTAALGLLILMLLVTWAWSWAGDDPLEIIILAETKSTEKDVQRWLDEPTNLPAEWWNQPWHTAERYKRLESSLREPPSSSAIYSNESAFTMLGEASATPLRLSTYEKLALAHDLDTTDTRNIEEFKRSIALWIPPHQKLLDDPEYRYDPSFEKSSNYSDAAQTYGTQAMVEALDGNLEGSVKAINSIIRTFKVAAGNTVPQYANHWFCTAVKSVSLYTSDTVVLRQLLSITRKARPEMLNIVGGALAPYTPTMVATKHFGFITAVPATRREMLGLQSKILTGDFASHLRRKNLTDPEVLSLLKNVSSKSKFISFSELLPASGSYKDAFNSGYLKRATKELIGTLVPALRWQRETEQMQLHWYHQTYLDSQRAKIEALRIDFLSIELARRTAHLESGGSEISAGDSVKGLLKEIPRDPYVVGDAPLRYDSAIDEYYSVGEDGLDGTGDDLYESSKEWDPISASFMF